MKLLFAIIESVAALFLGGLFISAMFQTFSEKGNKDEDKK